LAILRILRALIVEFEVGLVGTFELAFIFKFKNLLPGGGYDLGKRAFFSGDHRVLTSQNMFRDHAIGWASSVFHFDADQETVFAVVVAGVIGIDGVDVGADGIGNLLGNAFGKKSLPLCGNDAITAGFFGVGGADLDSNDVEVGDSCVLNRNLQSGPAGCCLSARR